MSQTLVTGTWKLIEEIRGTQILELTDTPGNCVRLRMDNTLERIEIVYWIQRSLDVKRWNKDQPPTPPSGE